MSIDLNALPRRDGAVEGRWAMLFRSPLNHGVAGAHFVGGMTVEPVDGRVLQRMIAAFGRDVLCVARVEGGEPAVVPPVEECGDEIVRTLRERRVDFDLAFPWGHFMRSFEEHERAAASEKLRCAQDALRDVAAERAGNPELADADAATITASLPVFTAELDEYYRLQIAVLEEERAARAKYEERVAAEEAAKRANEATEAADTKAESLISGGAEGGVEPAPVAETLPAPAEVEPEPAKASKPKKR